MPFTLLVLMLVLVGRLTTGASDRVMVQVNGRHLRGECMSREHLESCQMRMCSCNVLLRRRCLLLLLLLLLLLHCRCPRCLSHWRCSFCWQHSCN